MYNIDWVATILRKILRKKEKERMGKFQAFYELQIPTQMLYTYCE